MSAACPSCHHPLEATGPSGAGWQSCEHCGAVLGWTSLDGAWRRIGVRRFAALAEENLPLYIELLHQSALARSRQSDRANKPAPPWPPVEYEAEEDAA